MLLVKPKVSICVVTYNHERYIRQCLHSIVSQSSDFTFEVIVGDDCSHDRTRLIIQEFSEKYPTVIKYIFHKKNIGAFKNYAAIHRMATGEYIAHIDGDDFWFPNKLKLQVEFLESQPACPAVYSNAVVVAGNDEIIGQFNKEIAKVFDTNYLIAKGNFLCHSSMMYRKKHHTVLSNATSEFLDYYLHIKLSEIGPLGYINKNLTAYRSDSVGSIIRTRNRYIRTLNFEALLGVNTKIVVHEFLREAHATFLAHACLYELFHGDIQNLGKWMILAKAKAPIKFFEIFALACWIFIKIASSKVIFKISNFIRPKKRRVFYPR